MLIYVYVLSYILGYLLVNKLNKIYMHATLNYLFKISYLQFVIFVSVEEIINNQV